MGTALLLIYFVYGLAFWVMGLAVLLESGRASSPDQARSLHWLSSFGVLHGTHEWLEAYLLAARSVGTTLPSWLDWLKLALLAVSFACLAAYALTALRRTPTQGRNVRWIFFLPLLAAAWVAVVASMAYRSSASQWIPLLDAASRYLLAVPSALLASIAASATARTERSEGRPEIAAHLRLSAIGFGGYAAAQLFVRQLPWFPANLINQDAFLSITGMPIQAIRGLMAAVISAGLLRAMQAAERHRQAQLAAAHQARLAALEQQDTLRRDLLTHVVRSQEDERGRIARELHDEVAQLLSALTLQLGSLRLKLKRADTIEMVDGLQGIAKQMSQSLFHLVRDLRPSHLDNLGLVPALRFMLSQEYAPRGLDVAFHVTGHPRSLDGLIDTALFRVAQESLTNIVRHAHVNHAAVDVDFHANHVTLRVCDEGQGFDPAETFRPPRGWGLAGMRERVEALGGRFSLRSGPSHGTTIEAVIPLDPQPGEEAKHA